MRLDIPKTKSNIHLIILNMCTTHVARNTPCHTKAFQSQKIIVNQRLLLEQRPRSSINLTVSIVAVLLTKIKPKKHK